MNVREGAVTITDKDGVVSLDPIREALHAKEEAESIAREKRDNYVAATLGQELRPVTEDDLDLVRWNNPELDEADTLRVAGALAKADKNYRYQRMIQAALAYADAANRAADAAERYEELVVDEAARS